MDHGYLLTLSIHLAEIPTSPQNLANTSGIILWYDLREVVKKTKKNGIFTRDVRGGLFSHGAGRGGARVKIRGAGRGGAGQR